MVGIVLLGLGIVSMGLALVAAGTGFGGWAIVAGVACAAFLLTGGAVIVTEWRHRRARDVAGSAVRQGH
ncbi:hypothetical protein ACFRAQ_16410 [Nocardia sp. NPDC056611]|uniref:hypothetical protein n=1 Tax=unclassified Nocardia TaxID=2637762 RepID=UPI00367002E3